MWGCIVVLTKFHPPIGSMPTVGLPVILTVAEMDHDCHSKAHSWSFKFVALEACRYLEEVDADALLDVPPDALAVPTQG